MFMRFESEVFNGWSVDTNYGTELVELGELDQFAKLSDADKINATRVIGIRWRMSAPGYLDCTDWSLCDSEAECARECLDSEFSEPTEDMTDDKLRAMLELAEIAGDESASDEAILEMDRRDIR
jgi:hypothetical protein